MPLETGTSTRQSYLGEYAQKEHDFADQYERDAMAKNTAAQQQLQQGVADNRQAMLGQTAVRGANPAAMRGAQMAGDQQHATSIGQSEALRAAELQRAQQMRLGSASREMDSALGLQGAQATEWGQQQAYNAQQAAIKQQMDAQEDQFWARYAGGIAGAGGGMLGGMAGG